MYEEAEQTPFTDNRKTNPTFWIKIALEVTISEEFQKTMACDRSQATITVMYEKEAIYSGSKRLGTTPLAAVHQRKGSATHAPQFKP